MQQGKFPEELETLKNPEIRRTDQTKTEADQENDDAENQTREITLADHGHGQPPVFLWLYPLYIVEKEKSMVHFSCQDGG
jgi:hypothetical protein